MSTVQVLQHELQNELETANQLLRQISVELQQLKEITKPGGQFEENIKKNASLTSALANIQQINLENLPPLIRTHLHTNDSNHNNINMSNEQQNTLRDTSNMDETG